MPDLNIGVEVDTRLLERGIVAGRQFSKRSLPETINSALYHIAVDAQQRTPFVEPTTIDSELAVVVSPTIGKRGKPLKGKFTYGTSSGVGYTGKNKAYAGKQAPLAVFIIQKMVREGKSLGKKLPLTPGMFKGIPRAQAAKMMAAFVDLLIKNRHRSTHVLAAGWGGAITILKKFVSTSLRGQSNIGGFNLGTATPAIEGIVARGEIENNAGGEEGKESLNEALQVYGQPALQAAVDEEGRSRLKIALEKMGKGLESAVKPHWG